MLPRVDALATDASLVLVLGVALLVVGSTIYLLVSFAVMRSHTAPRPFRRSLRAFVGEAVAIAITQPLIPIFYVIGRRMGGPRDGRPIIFVHGYFQNRADFVFLARAVRRAKIGPLFGFNYDWRNPIAVSAERLASFVEGVCRETGQPRVAIVAHSLGGVIALEYVETPAGTARVERCVTIASPHAGVSWGGLALGTSARQLRATSEYMRTNVSRAVPIRALSIYSSHDNIVHPASTSTLTLRGGEDLLVDGVGHLGLLFSSEVAAATVRCLTA
jgi:triacylglycerol lipase